jgi:pimeloyl-ACP methyl ester carboxylesterase
MATTTRPAASGMRTQTIVGGGGVRLHVREWGPPDAPPVVLIHGISQDHQCWVRQYDGPLADDFRLIAFDLRGHGMSEAPADAASYADGRLWADDLAAVIDELDLDRPVLVGWSYGSFVIGDYLRAYGQGNVAALDFAGGVVRLGPAAFGSLIGPGFLDHFADLTADDLPTRIRGVRASCTRLPWTDSRPTTLRRSCAPAWWYPRRPEATWARATSTTTTFCAACAFLSWSATAERTPSSSRPWPSTCSTCVRRPRRPGTTKSATCRSWSARNASTTSSPR